MLTKHELIKRVAASEGVGRAAAKTLVERVFGIMADSLCRQEAVCLPGIGKISPYLRAERAGRDPRTGAPITIGACRKLKIHTSKAMLEALKN